MKKAFTFFSFAFCIFTFEFTRAQNIGIGTNTPHPSAALEVNSTNSGFLPPRMTFAQRNAIVNPTQGLIIYCTDCDSSGQPQFFNGTKWCNMLGGSASVAVTNLPSVTIGTQIWSSKNLDVANYRNGDPIPQVTDPTAWANLTTGAWCWYNNDSATYGAVYGRLYNWYAVNDPRGLAPQGWHVPTDGEWNRLTKFIDPDADTTDCCNNTAGMAMKSTTGWFNYGNGTNISGFTGLPGGGRNGSGFFNEVGYIGSWWSASEFSTIHAFKRNLFPDYAISFLERNYDNKIVGLSVRVVRD